MRSLMKIVGLFTIGAVVFGTGFVVRDLREIFAERAVPTPPSLADFARSLNDLCAARRGYGAAGFAPDQLRDYLELAWRNALDPSLRLEVIDAPALPALYRWQVNGDMAGLLGFCEDETGTLTLGFVHRVPITPSLGRGDPADAFFGFPSRPDIVIQHDSEGTLLYSDVFETTLLRFD